MPVVGAAAVTAVGGIVSAKMQSNAAKRAAAAQERAGSEALAYQRERAGIDDSRYMDRWNDYQRRHAAWEARNFGGAAAPGSKPAGGGGGASPSPAALMSAAPQNASYPAVMDERAAMDPAMTQGASVADLGGWEDWRRYGVGGGVQ